MWLIRYADTVVRHDIVRLDHASKQRIKKAIESKLVSDPMRFGKPLRHSLHHLRSLRVGDFRVLYHLNYDERMVSIVSIGHRRDVYEDGRLS
jgi:mRNA interferase RelE/StbE